MCDQAARILQSYENEIVLDKYLSDKFLSKYDPFFTGYLTFKTFKLIRLSFLGKMAFTVLIIFAKLFFIIFMFSIPLFIWVSAIFSLFVSKDNLNGRYLLCCRRSNYVLKNLNFYNSSTIFDVRSFIVYFKFLTFIDFLNSGLLSLKVIARIFQYKNHLFFKKTNIFHLYDLMHISLTCIFFIQLNKKKCSVITDSNLQRWDFLVSHLVDNGAVIQHGFIYSDIHFPNKFGRISNIYLFSESFVKTFKYYYSFKKFTLIITSKKMTRVDGSPGNKKILFIASSQPYVSEEVSYVKNNISRKEYYIILKLHPKHDYSDGDVNQLKMIADQFIKGDIYPECDIMVSYDSFLGYEYSTFGIPVVFIKEVGTD